MKVRRRLAVMSKTSSNDPDDTPGFNATFMFSLNDHTTWEGNIEGVIALSIHDRLLVDITRDDDEASPSGVVEDEPADPRGADKDYNFFQYYDRSGHRRLY
jgi:hypothetical protein